MSDTISLTYKELAERLGMSPDSARIKARRLKWPVIPGNHPGDPVHVRVPLSALNHRANPVRSPGDHPERTPGSAPPDRSGEIKVLEAYVETLKEQINTLRGDHAAEVKRLEGQAERERAATAEAERRYQNLLMDRAAEVERLEHQLRAAEDRAGKADRRVDDVLTELRTMLDALEEARKPWWRRWRRR